MDGGIKVEKCPQCGAPARLGVSSCEYCRAEFLVTSLAYLDRFQEQGIKKYLGAYKQMLQEDPNNGEISCAMGTCYLELGLYDLAIKYFARAIEQIPECGDTYYYYALALLKDKRPKVLSLTEIKGIEEYLNAAIQIDDTRSHYYYLWAFIKHDFYIKNGLRVAPPTFEDLTAQASSKPHNKSEIEKMLQQVPINDQNLTDLVRR